MTTVLIAQSSVDLANVGDTMMLQVALERFRSLWPGCRCLVLARNERALTALDPEACLVPSDGMMAWGRPLSPRAARHLPHGLYEAAEQAARYRLPALGGWAAQRKAPAAPAIGDDIRAFRRAMAKADLVVATGGGYLTDYFPGVCRSMLRLLEWAQQLKRPTLLFGQGIGPLHDAGLRTLAGRILPRVDMLALREGRHSLPLLEELQVPRAHIVVTGDDAIAPAYAARAPIMGDALGVNLRIARYSAITPDHGAAIGAAARRAAAALNAPLLPIPISTASDDQAAIAQALQLAMPAANQPPLTGAAAIAGAGRCRVVVTCSYHAGVFALAQGIPAVCLANTTYYQTKFEGLQAQFGAGCVVLDVAGADFESRLSAALMAGWQTAGEVRPRLLAAAGTQIEASRQAYQRAAALAAAYTGKH